MKKKKVRSKRYAAEIMTDTKYIDNLAFLASAPDLLHSLEKVARAIGLYMNANKMEYMCFKQKGAICTFSSKPLKLVYQFTYLSSNISLTESDVNICLAKTWNAISVY